MCKKPDPDSMQPLVTLDILRAVATSAVLLTHVRTSTFVEFGALPPHQQEPLIAALFALTRLGTEAVMVFFVLSGFLVGGQIIRSVERGGFDLLEYTINRATRILLPLVPALLLTVTINCGLFGLPVLENIGRATLSVAGLNDVLAPTVTRNDPLWSLSYEIWFYALAGTMAYVFVNRLSVPAFTALAAATLVFTILEARMLIFWTLGALVVKFKGREHHVAAFCAGTALAVAGLVAHQLALASKSFPNVVYMSTSTSQGILCLGIALMLPLLSSANINRRLSPLRRFAGFVSASSYTLYITHYPINSALDLLFPKAGAVTGSSLLVFGLRLTICIIASILLYAIFERHTAAARTFVRRRLHRRGFLHGTAYSHHRREAGA
jgi:peptidoglycan/LPS O-acetylase OafA/YrhL